MSKIKIAILILVMVFVISGCSTSKDSLMANRDMTEGITNIELSDKKIKVDGKTLTTDSSQPVYVANDIIYYEEGKDFTYGEGSEDEAHSKEKAANHTVVHITEPGTYGISGELSLGQIAIDLGEDAKDNPEAVVTLIMNGVDINCDIAPAVIFYNVYECGYSDAENASKDVDTSKAGANVIVADGTINNISGAYVARIYEAGTVVLNDEGTEVEDAEKLHKYDGAFYSKMSMNIDGGEMNTGILNIKATNEGLDSELHLTINGANINIESGNDGINTNEDGVSVTTINGGNLNINVTGETGEGDGIDSNGWLVINGGNVIAAACSISGDAGIDSDMGIYINGGNVIASGNMLDRIEGGGQNNITFNLKERQIGGETVYIKDEVGTDIAEITPKNDYSILIYSAPELEEGSYILYNNEERLAVSGDNIMGGFGPGGMHPEGMEPPEGMIPPQGMEPPEGFGPR